MNSNTCFLLASLYRITLHSTHHCDCNRGEGDHCLILYLTASLLTSSFNWTQPVEAGSNQFFNWFRPFKKDCIAQSNPLGTAEIWVVFLYVVLIIIMYYYYMVCFANVNTSSHNIDYPFSRICWCKTMGLTKFLNVPLSFRDPSIILSVGLFHLTASYWNPWKPKQAINDCPITCCPSDKFRQVVIVFMPQRSSKYPVYMVFVIWVATWIYILHLSRSMETVTIGPY